MIQNNNYYTGSLYLADWCYEKDPKERDADEEIIIEEEDEDEDDFETDIDEF